MNLPDLENTCSVYLKRLSPLFQREGVDILQLASTLLRVKTNEEGDWDSLAEANEMLQDLITINQADLSPLLLNNPSKTHLRLHLMSYVHLTEMSAPYFVLINLLRIRCGLNYSTNPFKLVDATIKGRPVAKLQKKIPNRKPIPSAHHKITEIKSLAQQAGQNDLVSLFDEFYIPPLRNAIAHSDYTLSDNEIRLIGNQVRLPSNPHLYSSRIPLDELGDIIAKAYDFYTAFFLLQSLARLELGKMSDTPLNYDENDKGILELLNDNQNYLHGFVLHWPNQTESQFIRYKDSCTTKNMGLNNDGEVVFFKGKTYKEHGLSPLVKQDQALQYTPAHQDKSTLIWKN